MARLLVLVCWCQGIGQSLPLWVTYQHGDKWLAIHQIGWIGMTTYPTTPGYKVPGPSREAAMAQGWRCRHLRANVKHLLSMTRSGLTADECAAELGESILSIRPRLTELRRLGLIEDSGLRRKNASGHMATVWRGKQ